ncbi:MAG TPA: sigma-70 family RNA polymerase sigma factor [Gaiellaceae bacterium]|nr:sigma-70 family RNA polymerase sigma factor [Gaiellaceae bacterium]
MAVGRDGTGPLRRMRIVNALAPTLPGRIPHTRSFAEAAEEHLDAVHRYLLMLTADPAAADDLTAETFEKALRSWRRYDPRRASERTWLCRIARSAALDHFRAEARRRRREERYAAEAPRDLAAPELGFSPELDAALRSLTAAEREMLALRIVLDLDAEAAARVLGASRTACSMRFARALGKLEERMEPHVVA